MAGGRGAFNSRFVAVMALAGSAIGLGNIWRFPYMVGQHGGAAFILVYIVCSLFISLPVFFAEGILGKSTRLGTFGALKKTAPKWRWAGYMGVLAAFVITSYYSVVGGWSLDYFVRSLSGGFRGLSFADSAGVFSDMTSSTVEVLAGFVIFLGLSALIVLAGVDKGIGAFSKVMMPLLFVMIVVIVVHSLSLPGARDGLDYLLKPDFSKLDGPAIAAALGQSFFSLSLGVGCVLTYSSYVKEGENLMATGLWTALFDTVFALLAGFAVMPAVFSVQGLEPGAGPSLVFETLPVVFSRMNPVVPVIFFLAVLVAALTSSISMFEEVAAWLIDEKGVSRKKAVLLVFLAALGLGSVCALVPRVFSACDFATSNIFMTLGALVFVLVVGWMMPKPAARKELSSGGVFFDIIWFFLKWVCPVAIVAIMVTNLL
ncbi:MAG: sodium-dependent transporter [Bacteroidales bacterium]|nr:sodium-dependent transporter [Bacteroidales bacterium]